MALKTVLSSLLVLAVCLVSSLNAGKFTITVRNEIDDKDDPICLKSVNVSIGKIEQISHLEGDPIGKEFNVTMSMPCVEIVYIPFYLEKLKNEGKVLDCFSFGNSIRLFSFEAFLSNAGTTSRIMAENLRCYYLPSNKGFVISYL
jgi:hypothetical protein